MDQVRTIGLDEALELAERYIKYISGVTDICQTTGQLRRKCKSIDYIEIICLPKMDPCIVSYMDEKKNRSINLLDGFFLNLENCTMNGPKKKVLFYPKSGIKVVTYVSSPERYGIDLSWTTGSLTYYQTQIATSFTKRGWIKIDGEYRRRGEAEKVLDKWVMKPLYETGYTQFPPMHSEKELFEYLGVEYIEPENRNW